MSRTDLTQSARRGLLVLLAGFLLYAGGMVLRHHRYIPDPQLPAGDRAAELADRLDPNTANVIHLAAIPDLGHKRATAIVAYRESITQPGRPAFRTIDDLLAVRGIGASMVENLRPYLTFPEPTTRPTKPNTIR